MKDISTWDDLSHPYYLHRDGDGADFQPSVTESLLQYKNNEFHRLPRGKGMYLVSKAKVSLSGGVLAILCLTLLIWVAAATLWSAPANAAPAAPVEITVEQPNGEAFEARHFGDEFNNGLETARGYTVVRNPQTRAYEYAKKGAGGDLEPSGKRAEDAPPPGLDKGLRPDPEGGDAPMRAESLESPALATPNTGSQKNLVILVQFADQASKGSTPAQWSDKFFGPANSVKDYYDEVSYGKLTMDPAAEGHGTANDGVVGWLTLNQNHPNTAGNTDQRNRLLTRDAINAANQYVNYASYDANGDGYLSARELHVTVIVAGQEAAGWSQLGKSVWGHNWALFGTERPTVDGVILGDSTRDGGYSQFGEWHGDHMATIGIMIHELGHDLNLPDLYDTDGSSQGVGAWSVMGSGTWLATTGNYPGSSPAHLDPFSKSYEGWLTPQKVSGSNLSTSIQQAETNATAIQLLDNPNGVDWTFGGSSGTGEYFLVENRQRVGYDAALPGTGLLVWHIDETRISDNTANATDSRRLVDVEEADGFGHLDSKTNRGDTGDPYPGSSNNTLFNGSSNPNSLLYSGNSSGITVSNISGSSSTMSANISTTGGDTIPANDDFANAQGLTGASATATGSNVGATKQSGEPNHAGNAGGKSVWYRWTPQVSGAPTIDTAGSDFDTLLAVYTGNAVNGLTEVASNDDENNPAGVITSKLSFTANAGTTYWIAVDGYNHAGGGAYSGNIKLKVNNSDTVAPTGTIKINGGAAYTKSPSVNLSLSATDPSPGSGIALMRLMNDGGSWTAWQPYATSKSWTLRNANGPRTVYVQYKDKVGNVSTATLDRITLDNAAPKGTVKINGGAATTKSLKVKLALRATDPAPASGLSQVRISNDGRGWSGWSAYTTSKAWKLKVGASGTRTVFVQYKDKAGNVSAAARDTIRYLR